MTKTGARKRLDDAIIELSTHASDQTGSALRSQGATRKQKSLRTALLRDHMAPIARIARVDLPQAPEIEPLRMPRGRPTATRLAAAANGMAKAAEKAGFDDKMLKRQIALIHSMTKKERRKRVTGEFIGFGDN